VFRGLLTSFVGHALLLAYALLSINRAPPDLPETVTIEASIVTPSELTRLKQGSIESKELEAQAKEEEKPEVSKKEAEKPKPVTAPPPASAPPPPEPEPQKDEIAKQIEEERVAAEQREKEAAEKAATAEAEAAALKSKIEAEQKAEEQRKQAEAEKKKQADAKKKAEEKKKKELAKKKAEERKKKLAEAKRKAEEEKKKNEFDPDRIAALLDKTPDKRGAPRTSTPPTKPTDYKGPTAGERRGTDSVLSAREADLLKSQLAGQLKQCWHLPGGGGGIETTVVTLRWRLKPDGSLDGLPQVVRPQSGPVFQIAAEAAVRAVTRCAPFSLPPDKYAVWQSVEWNFDPREMM
jgi:colicin import membrane protein